MYQNGIRVKGMGNGRYVHLVIYDTVYLTRCSVVEVYGMYSRFVYIQCENRLSTVVTSQCKHTHSVSMIRSCVMGKGRRLCETQYVITKRVHPTPLYLSA